MYICEFCIYGIGKISDRIIAEGNQNRNFYLIRDAGAADIFSLVFYKALWQI